MDDLDYSKLRGEWFANQFAILGTVLDLWSKTEAYIELVVRETLKLSTEETCIVCGPLGGGAKVALLKSLVRHHDIKPEFVEAVSAFQNLIGRNALVHGFTVYREWSDPWLVVSREVKDRLIVRSKPLQRYLEMDLLPAFQARARNVGLH